MLLSLKNVKKKMFRLLSSRVHQLGALSFNIKTFFPTEKKTWFIDILGMLLRYRCSSSSYCTFQLCLVVFWWFPTKLNIILRIGVYRLYNGKKVYLDEMCIHSCQRQVIRFPFRYTLNDAAHIIVHLFAFFPFSTGFLSV